MTTPSSRPSTRGTPPPPLPPEPTAPPARVLRPGAVPTILWGGLLVGALDAADALVAFGLLGSTPVQVYQFVASGALGPAAFQGGLATAALGLGIHFLIAFALAATFFLAARLVPGLLRFPVTTGLVYGVLAYFMMNDLVLPLSAVPKSPFSLPLLLNGVIGHALFVGLPVSWLAWRSALREATVP